MPNKTTPNKVKKTNKRDEDLKALGVYPENPDETMDLLEEDNLEGVFSIDEVSSGEGEEEEV